ncbi:MAG: hypothetical protein AABX72_01095 [Nanoarchaeota archaeon]
MVTNAQSDEPLTDTSFLEINNEEECVPYDIPIKETRRAASTSLKGSCQDAKVNAEGACQNAMVSPENNCVKPCKKVPGKCSEGSIIQQTKVRPGSVLESEGFTVGHWYCAAESKGVIHCVK